jgi:hypothetical protein
MENLQERLNNVSGRIIYLKQEKARIEKEKKALEEELAKEGITDTSHLQPTIDKKRAELEATKAKFSETLSKFELRVTDLEGKVK